MRPRQTWITPQGQQAIGAPVTVILRPRLDDARVLLDGARDALLMARAAQGAHPGDVQSEYVERLAAAVERFEDELRVRA
jgi:hypothetical protein